MKKAIILLILLCPFAYAISLNVPATTEYVFTPNQQIKVDYHIGNSDPRPLTAQVSPSGGELAPYIKLSQNLFTIPAQSSQKFTLEINLPAELEEGLYPITVDVSETATGGGMSALTGVASTIYVISPYEQGHPYSQINTGPYYKPGDKIKVALLIKNIGKTMISELKADAKLVFNGQTLKQLTLTPIYGLQPFQSSQTIGEFTETENLAPGRYDIDVTLNKQKLQSGTTIGLPRVSITNTPKIIAGQQNEFDLTVLLENWNEALPEAKITLQIPGILHAQQKAIIKPGTNTLHFTGEAKIGKTGTYKSTIIVGTPLTHGTIGFTADVEGTGGVGGLGFKRTEKEQEEIAAGKAAELAEPTKATKTNTFLIVLLIASFAIFAFALGKYLGGKRKNEPSVPAP